MVREPEFDSAMANQNFQNSLAELRARFDAERETPTPPSGPLGGPVGSDRSKRDPSKEIVLNFAGGEYGIRNDAAANAIAKKYNLEIVRNPDQKSALPNYIFKSNGNVNDIISQIKNEPGIGYAEQNFVIPPPSVGGKPQPSQRPPQGPQAGGGEGLNYKGQQFYASEQPGYGDPYFQGSQRYQEREDYQNFLKQGGQRPPQGPQVGGGMGGGIPTPIPQAPQNAMATYNNLLQQGIQRSNTMNQDAATNFANMQAGAPTTQPASPAKANPVVPIAGMGMQQPKATPAPRKFSTVNTPSARFG
jgi:hypothetical protein